MSAPRTGILAAGLIAALALVGVWVLLAGDDPLPGNAAPVRSKRHAEEPRAAEEASPWAAAEGTLPWSPEDPAPLPSGPRPAQSLAFMVQVRERISGAPVDEARVTVVGGDTVTTGPPGRRAVLGEVPPPGRLLIEAAGYLPVSVDVPRDVGDELLVELDRVTTLFVELDVGEIDPSLFELRLVVDAGPARSEAFVSPPDAPAGTPSSLAEVLARGGCWEGELPEEPGRHQRRQVIHGVAPGLPLTVELIWGRRERDELISTASTEALASGSATGDVAPLPSIPPLESHTVTLAEGAWDVVTLGRQAFPEATLLARDVDGAPVPGARVSYDREGPRLPDRFVAERLVSDVDGRVVARLPAGRYDLLARDGRGLTASLRDLTLRDGTELELVLIDPPPLRVRLVREGDGLPADVPWLEAQGPGSVRLPAEPAGAPGEWWLSGPRSGTWELLVPSDQGQLGIRIDAGVDEVTAVVPEMGWLDVRVDTLGAAARDPGMLCRLDVRLTHRATGVSIGRGVQLLAGGPPSTGLAFRALRAGDWDVVLLRTEWLEQPGDRQARPQPVEVDRGVVRVAPDHLAELRLVAFPR